MPLQITSRHFVVQEDEKHHIEKKIKPLQRKFDRIDELAFTLTRESGEHAAEISFRAGALHIVSKATCFTLRSAIDRAVEKLMQRVTRERDKRWGNKKHAGRPEPADAEPVEEAEADAEEAVE